MEKITISNLSFSYPDSEKPTINNLSLSVNAGEFITLCGASGSGKSTLLRLIKPPVAPNGEKTGEIYFESTLAEKMSLREQSTKIGYICQDVDAQLVTDKVWHELAFGLENMGESNEVIRRRVAETASFFNLGRFFDYSVNELSGGLKQLLNLASVMTMLPEVLVLDEPTSQLDPIAATDFLSMLKRINRELGITVILCEHRLEELFPISDRIVVLEEGRIISDASPRDTADMLLKSGSDIIRSMPAAVRIWAGIDNDGYSCPVTVSQGREMLADYCSKHSLFSPKEREFSPHREISAEIKNIFFRYGKDSPDVLRDMNLTVYKGEFLALLGGNGAGKSTLLSVLFGSNKPYKGLVDIRGGCALLPQNPLLLLNGKTVSQALSGNNHGEDSDSIRLILEQFGLDRLGERHPYDLSGGEAQMAAVIKAVLQKPRILLLDEPTKGMDFRLKEKLASLIKSLNSSGVTVIMASHDIEFCAKYSDRCAMLFNGEITSSESPVRFFPENMFYTTSACVMSKGIIENAVTAEDIVYRCTGKESTEPSKINIDYSDFSDGGDYDESDDTVNIKPVKSRKSPFRIICGVLGAVLLIIGILINSEIIKTDFTNLPVVKYIALAFPVALLMIALSRVTKKPEVVKKPKSSKLSGRVIACCVCFCVMIPLTLFLGVYFLGDRQYIFISLLILLECMLPFFFVFEGRHPETRELVTLAVLCAIAIGSRAAFFALPQIKPLLAVVIISGIALGGESGFMVGCVSMLISNIFFGQGIWTPWQMLSAGLIGFFAGLLFRGGILRGSRVVICVFGFISTLVIYGGIMNFSTIISVHAPINAQTLAVYYGQGLPLDIIHGISTFAVLFFLSGPMLEKIERIKTKYGIV